GQRPVLEHGLGDLEIKRLELRVAKVVVRPSPARQRIRGAEQPRRDQESCVAEVPPRTDEPPLGQLVLPPPEPVELRCEPRRLPSLVPNRPICVEAGDSVPERRQNEIHLPPRKGDTNLIYKGSSLLERANPHDERLFPSGFPPRHTERAAFAARRVRTSGPVLPCRRTSFRNELKPVEACGQAAPFRGRWKSPQNPKSHAARARCAVARAPRRSASRPRPRMRR